MAKRRPSSLNLWTSSTVVIYEISFGSLPLFGSAPFSFARPPRLPIRPLRRSRARLRRAYDKRRFVARPEPLRARASRWRLTVSASPRRIGPVSALRTPLAHVRDRPFGQRPRPRTASAPVQPGCSSNPHRDAKQPDASWTRRLRPRGTGPARRPPPAAASRQGRAPAGQSWLQSEGVLASTATTMPRNGRGARLRK